MAHPLKHAESSAKKFGGKPDDYLPIHNWFDESKAFLADSGIEHCDITAKGFTWQRECLGLRYETAMERKFRSGMSGNST
jgi:hypothetical protein